MPRTRSLAWSELKIGVLTVLAIAIAAVAIFMLTGGRGFFWQRYNLKTRFGNVAGLKSGSPVRSHGDKSKALLFAYPQDLIRRLAFDSGNVHIDAGSPDQLSLNF